MTTQNAHTGRPLTGKVAIVTGASRGIGRAIAERLGQEGATVAFTYLSNDQQAQETVDAIKKSGSEALAMKTDVRQREQIQKLFAEVIQRFGRLDILVNNAAGKNIFKANTEMTQEEYDSMFDITRGVYFSLQEAAKYMADNGRIVSLSTGGTVSSAPAAGAYAGSKAAIEQFSKALSKELGTKGITVNTVLPGVTATDGLVLPKEQIQQMVAQTPLGRLGKPEDVASVVAMLVSEDAHWLTGQSIHATGGMV